MRALSLLAISIMAPAVAGEDAAPAPGDVVRGARVFQQCHACHSVHRDEAGLPGPNLAGVVGRPAAALSDYDYSLAMRAAADVRGLVWTRAALDAFLRDPETFVPGTSMDYPGLRDVRARANLIAYLADPSAAPTP